MAFAFRRSALERPASTAAAMRWFHSPYPWPLPWPHRFQQFFAGLIELDDALQVARYELIRAAACLKPGCCATAAFLKHRNHGALQHYLRDQRRLVRLSSRKQEKGIHCCWRNSPAVLV